MVVAVADGVFHRASGRADRMPVPAGDEPAGSAPTVSSMPAAGHISTDISRPSRHLTARMWSSGNRSASKERPVVRPAITFTSRSSRAEGRSTPVRSCQPDTRIHTIRAGLRCWGSAPAVIVRSPDPPPIVLCSSLPGGGGILREGLHRMSRRRLAAAMFFSAVIVVVLGLIVYTEQTNATQTASVWVVTHDVAAGAAFQRRRCPTRSGSCWIRRLQLRGRRPNDLSGALRTKPRRQRHPPKRRSDPSDARSSEVAITVEDRPALDGGRDTSTSSPPSRAISRS